MSEDSFEPDGTVRIKEIITHYRYVPQIIYEVTHACDMMSSEEQIKVLKYITRLTAKRITFRSLARKPTKKQLFRAIKKVDARNNL